MTSKSYKRRDVLKKSGVAGVIASSIPVFSQDSRATEKQEGLINKSSISFFEFSLSFTDEFNAQKITACGQFPSFIAGKEGIYLTKDSFATNNRDDPIVATQEGFQSVSDGEEISYSWLPLSHSPVGRGTFVQKGNLNEQIKVKMSKESVKIIIGGDELHATPGESDSFTQKYMVDYTNEMDKKQQEEKQAKVFLKNHGVSEMFSHKNLVLIPKNSEQGLQLQKMMSEKTDHNLGNWKKVYDFASAKAWGIELQGTEGHQ